MKALYWAVRISSISLKFCLATAGSIDAFVCGFADVTDAVFTCDFAGVTVFAFVAIANN